MRLRSPFMTRFRQKFSPAAVPAGPRSRGWGLAGQPTKVGLVEGLQAVGFRANGMTPTAYGVVGNAAGGQTKPRSLTMSRAMWQ
jgi:hypothetical protein